MKLQHAKLIQAMVEYDKGDVPRIQHFMKVHDFAVTIAHHHTYKDVEGIDWQIKTATGKQLLEDMFEIGVAHI